MAGQCNNLETLDFNASSKIREGLNGALKGYFLISLENLKTKCNELYCYLERGGFTKCILFLPIIIIMILLTKIKINEEYAKLVPQISQAEYESLKTSIQDNFRWSS